MGVSLNKVSLQRPPFISQILQSLPGTDGSTDGFSRSRGWVSGHRCGERAQCVPPGATCREASDQRSIHGFISEKMGLLITLMKNTGSLGVYKHSFQMPYSFIFLKLTAQTWFP